MRGSEKPPLVNWIYRNPNHDFLPVKELAPEECEEIFKKHQTKGTAEDLIQQAMTMDVSWDASLFTQFPNGFSDVSVNQQPTICADKVLGLQPRLPFQIEELFNVDVPGHHQQHLHNNVPRKQSRDQQSTDDLGEQPTHLNATFEQLALDLILNPPKPLPQQVNNNTTEESSPFHFLRSLFAQYPPQNTLQPISNGHDETMTTDSQALPPTPSDSDSSHDSPLDDIDDETLNPLSPFMSDDMYYYAMTESQDLTNLF